MQQRMFAVVLVVSMLLGCLTIATIQELPDSSLDGSGKGIQTPEIYSELDEVLYAIFGNSLGGYKENFDLQWEHDYGKLSWWSARYEGPQPIGDADNDGNNELLIGGRDPFMRVMKWDENRKTYVEQTKIVDPVFGLGIV